MRELKAYRKTNHLLFAEMVTALLFFIISFAVIIRIFAAADGMERRGRRREQASLCAQSIAEAYSVSGDAGRALELVFGDSFSECSEIGLDGSMKPSSQPEITLSLSEERRGLPAGEYSRLSISFTDDAGEIYSLECAAYIPEGGAAVG